MTQVPLPLQPEVPNRRGINEKNCNINSRTFYISELKHQLKHP